MNERTLSRGLSTSVVDALKAHGHILVVRGGAASLARELDETIAPALALVAPRVKSRLEPMSDEPTSTFGDESVDQAVEDLVARLSRALMSSDHVEDVFAEDAVIRRDIFRTIRDGLLAPPEGITIDPSTISVKLDTLGYIAATVSRRADAATLRQALDRAAAASHARFAAFSESDREAVFRVDGGGPDERLELEEAVADELADLAEQGIVELPTLERRVALARALTTSEQRALGARIDAAAEITLLRSGCAAAWDFADGRTIRITFTPLSEQDALGVDAPTTAFAREVAGLVASGEARAKAAPRAPVEPETTEPRAPEAAAPSEPDAPSSRRKAATRAKAAPSSSSPETRALKKAVKRATNVASKAPASSERGAEAAPKSSSSKRTASKTTKSTTKKS